MDEAKKVIYRVQCAYNPDHIFDKAFLIKPDTEATDQTEVQAFCPFCDKHVTVTVQGKVIPDQELLRKFGLA